MDSERIIAEGETEQEFIEPYTLDSGDHPRVTRAEVGRGEGEVERVDEEKETETWTDPGGTSGTTDSWYKKLRSWMSRTTRSGS